VAKRKEGALSNENAQSLLRLREKDAEERAKRDLGVVMSTPEGRRFIWSLIEDADTWGPSFAGESSHSTSYNEGRRAVGLALLFRCQRDATGLYVTALQEHLARLQEETAIRAGAANLPAEKEETE
jgi:hypothetical protein